MQLHFAAHNEIVQNDDAQGDKHFMISPSSVYVLSVMYIAINVSWKLGNPF